MIFFVVKILTINQIMLVIQEFDYAVSIVSTKTTCKCLGGMNMENKLNYIEAIIAYYNPYKL